MLSNFISVSSLDYHKGLQNSTSFTSVQKLVNCTISLHKVIRQIPRSPYIVFLVGLQTVNYIFFGIVKGTVLSKGPGLTISFDTLSVFYENLSNSQE